MIQANNLVKKFGKQTAVDHLSLNIENGMSYALLGANGAGKTTTMKMLASLLEPTSGEVIIDGLPMNRKNNEIKKKMGMVSQHFSLQREMTPMEVLRLHGMLHGMSSDQISKRTDELIHFAQMEKDKGKLVGKLSGGNKRKLMIIRAVMHNPQILFLDEPTVGLDASIRRTIWDLLRRLKREGMTIVLTTHYIEEASVLCDMIGMMCNGKLIAENTPENFMKTIEPFTVESFDGTTTTYQYFNDRESAMKSVESCKMDATVRTSNLEDVYIRYTKRKIE